jgi:hypothetical protein|tara:strand:- start:658 stop:852 length:195 start_codon:yes stop_codon:yes gene_type:complete
LNITSELAVLRTLVEQRAYSMDKFFAPIIFWGFMFLGLSVIHPWYGQCIYVFGMWYAKKFIDES